MKARRRIKGWYKYGLHPMRGNVRIKPNAHKWKVASGLVQLRKGMHQFRSLFSGAFSMVAGELELLKW